MRSRTLVALLLLLLVPSFAATAAVTRLFHEHERALAAERFARGDAALARGDAEAAVEELRTALSPQPPASGPWPCPRSVHSR